MPSSTSVLQKTHMPFLISDFSFSPTDPVKVPHLPSSAYVSNTEPPPSNDALFATIYCHRPPTHFRRCYTSFLFIVDINLKTHSNQCLSINDYRLNLHRRPKRSHFCIWFIRTTVPLPFSAQLLISFENKKARKSQPLTALFTQVNKFHQQQVSLDTFI
ncbi:unnamed protein product [Lactuca virosa]|uniref:Uncharacterized protein n=1 Tax=Lactuca virosa TaxID=75947 RepID=A0AAU9LF14_9ASTR|nr:unnamed protein product [Lactuca virosa]